MSKASGLSGRVNIERAFTVSINRGYRSCTRRWSRNKTRPRGLDTQAKRATKGIDLMKYGRMGGRRGILACIQQELCVQNLHGGSVERTVSRRSRHSSPHKVVVSRRLNRTSLVFAKSTQFHISPPDFSSPFHVSPRYPQIPPASIRGFPVY